MKKFVVLVGTSGAGKSTRQQEVYPDATVCSADHFWKNREFDGDLLGQAHAECFRNFKWALQRKDPLIVLDNTNTQLRDWKKYLEEAEARGYTVKVDVIKVDPAVGASRNVHNVPLKTCEKYARRVDRLIEQLSTEEYLSRLDLTIIETGT